MVIYAPCVPRGSGYGCADGGGNGLSSSPYLPREVICLLYCLFFASCSQSLLCQHRAGPADIGLLRDMCGSFLASDAAFVRAVECAD